MRLTASINEVESQIRETENQLRKFRMQKINLLKTALNVEESRLGDEEEQTPSNRVTPAKSVILKPKRRRSKGSDQVKAITETLLARGEDGITLKDLSEETGVSYHQTRKIVRNVGNRVSADTVRNALYQLKPELVD